MGGGGRCIPEEVHEMLRGKVRGPVLFAAVVLLVFAVCASAGRGPIHIDFEHPPVRGADDLRTLESLVKVADGLYIMTHYGDRDALFKEENQKAISDPLINHSSRYCSTFSAAARNSVVVGRNWDNQNVGSIIISLYRPAGGYSSISFSRAVDVGFGKDIEIDRITCQGSGSRLLLAPFYMMDGINECGLTVAVAGVPQTEVEPQSGKDKVYVTYLMRKILDEAGTVEEAADLVDDYIPFDLDESTLDAHFQVADRSGQSVILEYVDGGWAKVHSDRAWQVMTTKPIYQVTEAHLRESCWRYESIATTLEEKRGSIDWKEGIRILQGVEQEGTTWSSVYLPVTREIYLSVYKDWETIYHLSVPEL
jgi:choloylglycine hydrolase